ncbi:killer cell lectin-like receptor subfamily B member 1B allele A isoform X6 [Ambystoma mexicanum]|uniref:killer cell lectin-like receptor subfamily B member 1B allele A isoform X6 n=1 Tax=Ambystoma mexicanum TaxID=8296 RepID=UPI0037E8E8CB
MTSQGYELKQHSAEKPHKATGDLGNVGTPPTPVREEGKADPEAPGLQNGVHDPSQNPMQEPGAASAEGNTCVSGEALDSEGGADPVGECAPLRGSASQTTSECWPWASRRFLVSPQNSGTQCQQDDASRGQPKGAPCPPEWEMKNRTCYYISKEAKSWDQSQEFCSLQNGTLAVIRDENELPRILRDSAVVPLFEAIKRIKTIIEPWIVLRKGGDGWRWVNGDAFSDSLIKLVNDAPSLDCAYLNTDNIGPLDCSTSRRWICTKEITSGIST